MRLAESELAISSWRRACALSPSWSTPHAKIALALASTGRFDEAVAEAKVACRCDPGGVTPNATLAAVRFEQLEHHPDSAASKELFTFISSIQKQVPGEPQTLPAYVALLNRNGQRDKAVAVLESVIRSPRAYDQGVILRLAGISRVENLGLENELLSAAGSEGNTPQAVLARAMALHASGKTPEGLALLRAKAKTATTQPARWQTGNLPLS